MQLGYNIKLGGIMNNSNHIEKEVKLKASISRVWQALTNYKEFGSWFGVKINSPFIPGNIAIVSSLTQVIKISL
jgi:hypothetical protein